MQRRYHENDIMTQDIYRVRKVLQNRMLLTQWSGLEFIRFLFPLPFPRFEESTEGREFAFSFQGRRSRARAQTVRPQSSAILLFRCNKKRQLHVDLCSTHCARDIRNGVARSRENHDACWSLTRKRYEINWNLSITTTQRTRTRVINFGYVIQFYRFSSKTNVRAVSYVIRVYRPGLRRFNPLIHVCKGGNEWTTADRAHVLPRIKFLFNFYFDENSLHRIYRVYWLKYSNFPYWHPHIQFLS